ncbi:UNVERIFIED_CONTAM: hypothetical protein GTU68_050161 [Idotea baltica]|uniref:ABC transporter ATP-binding protein n=1 Tax=unclassified Roseibium TaxID=2629323 RepID=UPI0026E83E17|nr:hypothetical protein [Idotea baltica]
MTTIVDVRNLAKDYAGKTASAQVFKNLSLQVPEGQMCCIVGDSGCGKTTLLNILGGLDHATSGTYRFGNIAVDRLHGSAFSDFRKNSIGFIFQNYCLIPYLNTYENVVLPLMYRKIGSRERDDLARSAIGKVKLEHRLWHKPAQLSGGQQQRVAIARALVTRPPLVVADEPTGNLDLSTSLEMIEILRETQSAAGTTIIYVTHQHKVAELADRICDFKDLSG